MPKPSQDSLGMTLLLGHSCKTLLVKHFGGNTVSYKILLRDRLIKYARYETVLGTLVVSKTPRNMTTSQNTTKKLLPTKHHR